MINSIDEAKEVAFQFAVYGLASQNWLLSLSPRGNVCVYNGQEGRRCAFGHCLVPEIPSDLNGARALKILENYPHLLREPLRSWIASASEDDKEIFGFFITALQVAHDGANNPHHMRNRFLLLKKNYLLSSDVPE